MNNQDSDAIHVVSLADEAYAKYLCVTFLSILQNLNSSKEVTIKFSTLDCGITEKSKYCIECCLQSIATVNLEINWISPPSLYLEERFGSLPKQLNKLATYIRIDVCNLVHQESGKIIFLDSDTLVLGNIVDLWQIPLENYHTLAARDLGFPRFKYRQWKIHKFPKAFQQHHPETPYFNAGVMMIDIGQWQQHNIAEKAFREAITAVQEDPSTLECYDQDPLNLVWKGQVKEVGLEWNAQSSVFMPNARMAQEQLNTNLAQYSPKILHYTMPHCKPWVKNCVHPLASPYYPYLQKVEQEFTKQKSVVVL